MSLKQDEKLDQVLQSVEMMLTKIDQLDSKLEALSHRFDKLEKTVDSNAAKLETSISAAVKHKKKKKKKKSSTTLKTSTPSAVECDDKMQESESILHEAEIPWKPSVTKLKPSEKVNEENQIDDILKSARSILNKLTPEKLDPLVERLKSLPINSENRLKEVVNLIFVKATDEPLFCEVYARLCHKMKLHRVLVSAQVDETGEVIEEKWVMIFSKLMLDRCLQELERNVQGENEINDLREEIENSPTKEETRLLEIERYYAQAKKKRRILGNVQFIGELFNLGVFDEETVLLCINAVICRGANETSLECLSKLLTTAGKNLQKSHDGRQKMKMCFQIIGDILLEKKTSYRTRFMIMDVQELKENNWIKKKFKVLLLGLHPKTLDEIHQEWKEDQEKLALKLQELKTI